MCMCGSGFCALTINAYCLYAVGGPYRLPRQRASRQSGPTTQRRTFSLRCPTGWLLHACWGTCGGCPVEPLLAALLPDTATHDLHVDINLDAGSYMRFDLILLSDLSLIILRCATSSSTPPPSPHFLFFGVNEYIYVYIWGVCECGVLFWTQSIAHYDM